MQFSMLWEAKGFALCRFDSSIKPENLSTPKKDVPAPSHENQNQTLSELLDLFPGGGRSEARVELLLQNDSAEEFDPRDLSRTYKKHGDLKLIADSDSMRQRVLKQEL